MKRVFTILLVVVLLVGVLSTGIVSYASAAMQMAGDDDDAGFRAFLEDEGKLAGQASLFPAANGGEEEYRTFGAKTVLHHRFSG